MVRSRSFVTAVMMAGVTLLAASLPDALGVEATVRAQSAARGQGFFFEIGQFRALFMGALHGVLYVESGPDALDGAAIVCPVTYVLEGVQPTLAAEGYCTITKGQDHKIYARWTCSGAALMGCRGRLTLTGGTGRFAGITGESDMVVRSSFVEFADSKAAGQSGAGVVQETGGALLILPALRYRIP